MRKTLLNTMGLVLALFGATNASAQETFPYSVDFLTASDLSGWTAIDNSETPGVTWEFGTGTYSAEKGAYVTAARMPEDNSSVHNDYLVSPAFTLTKGYTYTINVTGQFKGSALCGFQVGKSATDMSANTVVSNDISSGFGIYYYGYFDYNGNVMPKTTSVTFVPTEDGTYYFSLYAHSNYATDDSGDFFYIYDVSVSEQAPEPSEPGDGGTALPYSITFDSTNDVWSVLDASPTPGTSWEFNNDWGSDGFCIGNAWTATPSYCIKTDSGEPNDYYVSPSFSLKAGKTYTVKTSSGTMYSTPATLSVEYTTTPTDAASFTKLSDIDMPSSGVQYDNSYDLTVPEDGLYSFAFHATNTSTGDKTNWVYLYAIGFSIEEKVGGETPDPGTDPDKPDPPVTEDQEGTLPYDMTFDSAEKFATWTTMDNSETPGVTWAYTASDFAGKPAAHMGVDATSETCDWLVSPKFELKEGKSYTITVDAASGPNNELNLILDYFVGSKSADNQKTIEWIGSKLPATVGESGEVKNQWTLDANKDGVYLFAFRALNWGANNVNDAISIYSVKIEEKADGEPEAPVALPYEVSFEQEENAAAWTAMDRSGNTGSTWSWNSWGYQEYDSDWNPVGDQHPCVGFSSDWNTDANDYWVSPAFALEAGKTYVAKAHTANNRSCLESGTTSFTMKLGTNKKVQGSFDQTLGSIELNTVYDRDPSAFEFSVQESGNYYVAFHISDSEGSNAYGYIFDFSLAEKEGAAEEPVATAPVADLTATEVVTRSAVELAWTNPTKDLDGKDLPADAALTVKVYEGEELLATLDAQAPGSEGTFTQEYTADTYAGEHNYKVVVVYKEKESEAATATLTVVVDAINGVVVPADAKVSVHTLGGAAVGNNLSTLGKGTYIVTMKRADGTMKTVKVTK